MGWFSEETGAERAARIRGENQARAHGHHRTARDEAYERQQELAWERRNWENKKSRFEREVATARAERRKPVFDSIADVPDMRREQVFSRSAPAEPEDTGVPPILIKIAVVCIIIFFVLPALAKLILPAVAGFLQVLGLVLLSALALLLVTWGVLRLTAGGDPVRLQRAKMFNPYLLTRAVFGAIKDEASEPAARKAAEQ